MRQALTQAEEECVRVHCSSVCQARLCARMSHDERSEQAAAVPRAAAACPAARPPRRACRSSRSDMTSAARPHAARRG